MAVTRHLHVVIVIATYWVVSISMVFANKYLVGGRSSRNLAIFITWLQCMVSVATVVLVKLGISLHRYMKGGGWSFQLPLHLLLHREVLIMTVVFVCMIAFNNLCLKLVGIAFFQISRSTTLIFTVIFSVWLLKKQISWKISLCCFCVVAGFMLGVDQESVSGTLSLPGVAFGVLTSIFIALTGIFTKKCLELVDHDAMVLTFLTNLNGIFVFLPLLIVSGQALEASQSTQLAESKFWIFLLFSGVMAFSISFISAKQIDITSPVTHHISANSKSVCQTILAVLYYGQPKPVLWWCSIALVVGGALSYAILRVKETSNKDVGSISDKDTEEKTIGNVHLNNNNFIRAHVLKPASLYPNTGDNTRMFHT